MGVSSSWGIRQLRYAALRRGAVALLVMVMGCENKTVTPSKFLALGDSYTCGQSVDPSVNWPFVLVQQLKAEGIDLGEPTIIARTGWTTDELSRGMDQEGPKGPFELVTLLVGVNNQFRGRDAEQYRGEFGGLLKRAIELAGGRAKHVVVLSIPDWGVMPFAEGQDRAKIGEQIDRFNAINREETERLGARYVDITAESRGATTRPALVAGDGLHPSGEMYAEWVKLVLPEAMGALRQH